MYKKRKKLAVIGRGTAGSLSLAHFHRWLSNRVDIEWHYDPNTPTQAVGEGSPLTLPKNLLMTMGFVHSDLHYLDGTVKTGIYKDGWGQSGKPYTHNFHGAGSSYHFNALKLQEYTYNFFKDKVKIVEHNTNSDDIDADLVMDCSGMPKNYDDFYTGTSIPVNSVYVTQCYWDMPRFNVTLTVARPYGWVFGIPLKNRCSIGYMYNNSISSLDEVKEDVKAIFEQYNLNPSPVTNAFSFKNYYRKNFFVKEGNRGISYNGNAAFFLEPLEATSLACMDNINRGAYDCWLGQISVEGANSLSLNFIRQCEVIIAMHYYAGSKYKTPFWEMAKEKSTIFVETVLQNDKNLKNILKIVKNNDMSELFEKDEEKPLSLKPFGPFWLGSWKENINGLGIEHILDNLDGD